MHRARPGEMQPRLAALRTRLRELPARLRRIDRKRALGRFGKWLAIAVVAIAGSYLVLGNLFLKLGGVPWLVNRSSDDVIIEHGTVWTWWPGRVKVSDFRLAFRNDDIEFEVRVDSAVTDISLWELTKKRFVARSLDGKGIRYKMRLVRDPEQLGDDDVNRALPRIRGFDDLPARQTTVPNEPPDDGKVHVWSVRIDGIDSSLAEVWIEQVRVTGPGHLNGSFEVVPNRDGWITGVVATVDGGVVERGDVTMATDLHQMVWAQVPWFDCRENGAESLERHLDAVVAGDAFVLGDRVLGAIPFFTSRGLRFQEVAGPARARGALLQGKLMAGSTIDAEPAQVGARTDDVSFVSTSGATARLLGTLEGMRLDVRSPSIDVKPKALEPATFHTENPSMSMTLRAAPAMIDVAFESMKIDVPASSANLAELDGKLGPVRLKSGAAFARVTATLDEEGNTSGDIAMTVKGLDSHGGRARVRGDAKGSLHIEKARLADVTFPIGKGSLDVSQVDIVIGDAHPAVWWAHADIGAGSFSAKPRQGPMLDLPVKLSAKDASPVVAIFSGEDIIPGFAAKLFDMKGLQSEARLRLAHGVTEVDIAHAEGEGSGVEGILLAGSDVMRGAFRLRLGILHGGVSFREGGPRIQLVPTAAWLADEKRELRSTLPKRVAAIR